jgi:D-alanyl-D-alanine carboxypeptidase
MPPISRRHLLRITTQAAAAAALGRFVVTESAAQSSTDHPKYRPAFTALDAFVESYMRTMNSPGMTLGLADADGIQRVATYGFTDLEQKQPVEPAHLFQIGSITKSFVGLLLLQLSEEGKLDLHKPITDYCPFFRISSPFPPITTHHLLTHSSGLPDGFRLFLPDPAAMHRPAYAPGEHFHYCNTGYELLGYLIWTLEGVPFGESVRRRIFEPLGMADSFGVISHEIRARTARNYMAFQDDRPYARDGRMAEAPGLVEDNAAGCISSTPADMARYMHMLIRGGRSPKGRLVSEAAFAEFLRPHIKAEEFGPGASYGYGIASDTLDSHRRLRHTGGMVSFMSALQVDLDEGVGAFASINAQQGYRPNPVAQYALQVMRDVRAGKPPRSAPPPDPPWRIEKAAELAGSYASPSGRTLEVVNEGERLFVRHQGTKVAVERSTGSGYIVRHPGFERFQLTFGRTAEKSPVTEVAWGPDWYVNERYAGPRTFDHPKAWEAYVGHYRNDSPWRGSFRVVIRKGRLWLDGTVPLVPVEGARFRFGDTPYSPEWIEFRDQANGLSMHAILSGADYWRTFAP